MLCGQFSWHCGRLCVDKP
jgi:hypothetical protein